MDSLRYPFVFAPLFSVLVFVISHCLFAFGVFLFFDDCEVHHSPMWVLTTAIRFPLTTALAICWYILLLFSLNPVEFHFPSNCFSQPLFMQMYTVQSPRTWVVSQLVLMFCFGWVFGCWFLVLFYCGLIRYKDYFNIDVLEKAACCAGLLELTPQDDKQ